MFINLVSFYLKLLINCSIKCANDDWLSIDFFIMKIQKKLIFVAFLFIIFGWHTLLFFLSKNLNHSECVEKVKWFLKWRFSMSTKQNFALYSTDLREEIHENNEFMKFTFIINHKIFIKSNGDFSSLSSVYMSVFFFMNFRRKWIIFFLL